ncbi:MAG: DNA repair protein RecN [Anaerolineaceae bacterium]|nr:DNA repair protein RecN [Anaerolineaceae bacterium]
MLLDLSIRNFAIIPQLDLEFDKGLTVFTGETGAGKSIILDALNLILGGKAESGMIRKGAERASVEASFRVEAAAQALLNPLLDAEGLLEEPGFLTLAREIRAEGRSIARVNGRSVSQGLQSEIGEILVDTHGQSEHLSLLKVRSHLSLLDRFAHDDEELKAYQALYARYQTLSHKLEKLQAQQLNADQRQDMLQFQIREIEEAKLKPGEEEALRAERTRLANAETLNKLTAEALSALDEGSPETSSATDLLGLAIHHLTELNHIDPSLSGLAERVEGALTTLSDAAYELRAYLEAIEFNPKRLDQIEERLNLMGNLKRKYGGSIKAVIDHLAKNKFELDEVVNSTEQIQQVIDEINDLTKVMAVAALALSRQRTKAAAKLSQVVENHLGRLQMHKARFEVQMRTQKNETGLPLAADGAEAEEKIAFDANGMDHVEFLIETNPGEGLKPLAKIASGGETSRLMLALKNALAEADQIPTLVFDEIDQGIGGRVGLTVGEMLWQLGRSHQVLCVTHLPQLAAFGDRHYSVSKSEMDGRTVTKVTPLEGRARTLELAAMMGQVSEATLNSADDLLTSILQIKGKI